MNGNHQGLFPEVLSPPFLDEYGAIPKVLSSELGMKEKKAKESGWVQVVAPHLAKKGISVSGEWVAPQDNMRLDELLSKISIAREVQLQAKKQIVKDKLFDEYQEFYKYGVITNKIVTESIASDFNTDCIDECLFWKAVKTLGWGSNIIKSTDTGDDSTVYLSFKIVFGGETLYDKHKLSVKELLSLRHIVFSGDIASFSDFLSIFINNTEIFINSISEKTIKIAPPWVPKSVISACCVKQYRKYGISKSSIEINEVIGSSLSAINAGEETKFGLKHTTKGYQLQTVLPIKSQNIECEVPSIVPAEYILNHLKRSFAGSLSDALDTVLKSYKTDSLKKIHVLMSTVLCSKEYKKIEKIMGELEAKTEVVKVLLSQMATVTSHCDFDTNVLLKGMAYGLNHCIQGKEASVKLAKCRVDLPEKLSGFYPIARRLNRKLTMISGPTNSGKTYVALERLKEANTGVYLGPLRLLALEVRDRLIVDGYLTSLFTGEFIDEIEGAQYKSATIEMLDFTKVVDLIIIDEAQMLGDEQRGPVWLQAILGAPAKQIIILGAPEAEGVIKSLAEYLEEELTIERKERFTPYSVNNEHTPLADIPPASAVIAFSRKNVLALASELTDQGKKPAVIYGALSPAVRKEQARRFSEGEADILVASDAIGMGLNLPIKAVFFSSAEKYNGISHGPVPHDLVWQIAGRAGRYGMYEQGVVGAINKNTLAQISNILSDRPSPLEERFRYGVTAPVIRILSEHLDTIKLVTILAFFKKHLLLSEGKVFTPCVDDDQMSIAEVLDNTELLLEPKIKCMHAPVPMDSCVVDPMYGTYLSYIGKYNHTCDFRHYKQMLSLNCKSLSSAESAVKLITLYCWLHYRFPKTFPLIEEALVELDKLTLVITGLLTNGESKNCTSCGDKLKWDHSYGMCEFCFNSRRKVPRRDPWDDFNIHEEKWQAKS